MQDVDAPSLVWAVRREIDIVLLQRVHGNQAEKLWIANLEQVAEVSAVDGFAYLLAGLLTRLTEDSKLTSAPQHIVKGTRNVLNTCLTQAHLRCAPVEALRQAQVVPDSIPDLATALGLTSDQKVRLSISFWQSEYSEWQREGANLLDSVISAAVNKEASLSPEVLHSVCALVHISSLDLSVADNEFRDLLASTHAANQQSSTLLRLFADPSHPPSARAAAAALDTTPLAARDSSLDSTTSQLLSAVLRPGNSQQVRALGPLVSHTLDVHATLSQISDMGTSALADALKSEGPPATHRPDVLQSILAAFPSAGVHEIAHVVSLIVSTAGHFGHVANTTKDPTQQWNMQHLAQALRNRYSSTNWPAVFAALDIPTFSIADDYSFKVFFAMWRLLTEFQAIHATLFTTSAWQNIDAQVSLLFYLINTPADAVDFHGTEHTIRPVSVAMPDAGDAFAQNALANGSWFSLDLLSVLATAAEQSRALETRIHSALEPVVHTHPEALVAGFGCLPFPAPGRQPSALARDVVSSAGPQLVMEPSRVFETLQRIHEHNPSMLHLLLLYTYNTDATSINHILTLTQDFKILLKVLESNELTFVLDLAVLANRREFLNLEKWLLPYIQRDVASTVSEITLLLDKKLRPSSSDTALSGTSLRQILTVLTDMSKELPSRLKGPLHRVLSDAIAAGVPRELQDEIETFHSQLLPEWCPDVVAGADELFKRLYAGGEEVLPEIAEQIEGMMRGPEIEVVEHVMQEIIEEFKFLHLYPIDKLRVTAGLVGTLLGRNILIHTSCVVTCRLIIEGLKDKRPHPTQPNGPPSLAHHFSLVALRNMLPAFHNSPRYCERVLTFKDILQTDPELYENIISAYRIACNPDREPSLSGAASLDGPVIERSLSSMQHQNAQQLLQAAGGTVGAAAAGPPPGMVRTGSAAVPSQAAGALGGVPVSGPRDAGAQSSVLLQTAEDKPVPETKTTDRVAFLINNVTNDTVLSTAAELNAKISPQYYHWFANYLVQQRAANEVNYQPTYVLLLDTMDRRELLREVLSVSYQAAHMILESEAESRTESNRRSMLKSLGSWIGKLTLARNAPILRKALDIKAILIKAYKEGYLVAAYPFVQRLLSEAGHSPVFGALKNPWTLSILGLMKEIYNMHDLKVALKFELEALLKTYNADDVAALQPSTLLTNVSRTVDNNPDIKEWIGESADVGGRGGSRDVRRPTANLDTADSTSSLPQLPSQGRGPEHSVPPRAASPPLRAPPAYPAHQFAQLHNIVVIPIELEKLRVPFNLAEVVPLAVDRAVSDILIAAVERSVSISCKATAHIVLKDFVHDRRDEVLRNASQAMVASLAGSLALVTCREALQTHLLQQFRNALAPYADPGYPGVDEIANVLMHANHAVGCHYIERMAIDKSQVDIEDHIAASIECRRKHNPSQPFFDANATLHHPHTVPSMLQLSLNPADPLQQTVYQGFHKPPAERALLSASGVIEARFAAWLDKLDRFALAHSTLSYQQMAETPPQSHAQAALIEEVKALAAEVNDPQVTQNMALHLFQHMWMSQPSRYRVTLTIIIIDTLIKLTKAGNTRSVITAAWLRLSESQKWILGFVEVLLQLSMLHVGDLDAQVARSVATCGVGTASSPAPHMETLEPLVKRFVIETETFFIQDLQATVTALRAAAAAVPDSAPPPHPSVGRVLALVERAIRKSRLLEALGSGASGMAAIIDPRSSLFEEHHILHNSNAPNASQTFAAVTSQRQRCAQLLEEWLAIYEADKGWPSTETTTQHIHELQHQQLLDDQAFSLVIRTSLDLLVVHHALLSCLPVPPPPTLIIDALLTLLGAIVRRVPNSLAAIKTIFLAVRAVFYEAARRRGAALQSRPFHRILLGLLHEVPLSSEGLHLFAQLLLDMSPVKYPAFAFTWMELLSHPKFMPPLLLTQTPHSHSLYAGLLRAALTFLAPFIEDGPIPDEYITLYHALLRAMLVVMKDFPAVFTTNCMTLLPCIPPRCVHLRQTVLSAFPPHVRMSDPMTHAYTMDSLTESTQDPDMDLPKWNEVFPPQLIADLDALLRPSGQTSDSPRPTLTDLISHFRARPDAPRLFDIRPAFDGTLLAHLSLFLAVADIKLKGRGTPVSLSSPPFQLLSSILNNVTIDECAYLLLYGMADHLRYPSSHTHYMSTTIIALFDAGSTDLREIITRVLLERVLVTKPNPWGVVATFRELMSNPKYDFWSHAFIDSAPSIKQLFLRLHNECQAGAQGSANAAMLAHRAVRV